MIKIDPKLSIVIPVYNEEKRLDQTLKKVLDFRRNFDRTIELIFVDDGSTDKTLTILKKYEKFIRIIRVWPNRGKGNATKVGVLTANSHLILFMDADLATPLSEIPKILDSMESFDIVIGSRTHLESNVQRNLLRLVAGRVFSFVKRMIIPLAIKDTQCGFKLFRREAAIELFGRARIERWSFDAEILYLADKLNFSVGEIPIKWAEKDGSKVKLFRDAFVMVRDLLRIRYYDLLGVYNYQFEIGEKGLHEKI